MTYIVIMKVIHLRNYDVIDSQTSEVRNWFGIQVRLKSIELSSFNKSTLKPLIKANYQNR